jgi:excisionase family DNA binding protein
MLKTSFPLMSTSDTDEDLNAERRRMGRTAKYIVNRSLHDSRALSNRATVSAAQHDERNCAEATRSDSGPGVYNEESRHPYGNNVFGVDELAEFFKCSTEKIRRLARKGELPAFKFGKSWFMRERDLEAYLDRVVGSTGRSEKER